MCQTTPGHPLFRSYNNYGYAKVVQKQGCCFLGVLVLTLFSPNLPILFTQPVICKCVTFKTVLGQWNNNRFLCLSIHTVWFIIFVSFSGNIHDIKLFSRSTSNRCVSLFLPTQQDDRALRELLKSLLLPPCVGRPSSSKMSKLSCMLCFGTSPLANGTGDDHCS